MRTIDWTALGTCIQAAAVVFATVFAVVQYYAIQRNERAKRTIALMSGYDKVKRPALGGVELTVAQALPALRYAGEHIQEYLTGRSDYYANKMTSARDSYLHYNGALVIVLDYYNEAGRLNEWNLIDLNLFLSAQSYNLNVMLEPAQRLLKVEEWHYDFHELEELVAKAGAYLEKHPVMRPSDAGTASQDSRNTFTPP